MITENKVVTLNYILSENSAEGLILENTYDGKPLEFIFGMANMMPSFEDNIANLEAGSEFSFKVKSDQAYGEINPNAIVDLDINIFKVHDRIDYEMLKLGNVVPMQDSKGNRMNGVVLELNDDKVKFDFNHPLAGKDLFFRGEVLTIREATEEELEHGHLHGSGGGCGCGSGGGCGTKDESDQGGCGCGSNSGSSCGTEEKVEAESDSCGSGCGCH